MNYLNFSVSVNNGRSFSIPLEEAKRIIKENAPDANIDDWNADEIAEELYNFYSDDITKYEQVNDYLEAFVQDVEIVEGK